MLSTAISIGATLVQLGEPRRQPSPRDELGCSKKVLRIVYARSVYFCGRMLVRVR